ncbi:hypothetical protein [Azohydromonas aeria]|uniref:hypothetical protein n=1 Tax=Azohydromonas aeria TaxID=2590212 RepID=UPI0012F85A5F|nr:hypothetical protein [Azohydromonas aeria]
MFTKFCRTVGWRQRGVVTGAWLDQQPHPFLLKLAILVASLLLSGPVRAAPNDRDLHLYWEQRCQDCHGHSGAFSRRFLQLRDGRLADLHHGTDLERFLHQHYLADELVAPVMAMLTEQVTTPALFAQRCAACHGTAADFVRKSLTLRQGELVGKDSGRPVAQTLLTHGKLTEKEASLVVESLRRVHLEVAGANWASPGSPDAFVSPDGFLADGGSWAGSG